jgi:hypothetical protein
VSLLDLAQHFEHVLGAAVGAWLACRATHADLTRAIGSIKALCTSLDIRAARIERHPAISSPHQEN